MFSPHIPLLKSMAKKLKCAPDLSTLRSPLHTKHVSLTTRQLVFFLHWNIVLKYQTTGNSTQKESATQPTLLVCQLATAHPLLCPKGRTYETRRPMLESVCKWHSLGNFRSSVSPIILTTTLCNLSLRTNISVWHFRLIWSGIYMLTPFFVKHTVNKLWYLKRNLKHSLFDMKLTAYKILVQSVLEYASQVRDPHTVLNIDKLQKVPLIRITIHIQPV